MRNNYIAMTYFSGYFQLQIRSNLSHYDKPEPNHNELSSAGQIKHTAQLNHLIVHGKVICSEKSRSDDTTWHDVTPRDMTSHHVTWRHTTWQDVTPRDMTSHHVTWRHTTWHDVTPRDMTSPPSDCSRKSDMKHRNTKPSGISLDESLQNSLWRKSDMKHRNTKPSGISLDESLQNSLWKSRM
jgi:hypothetical protein